MAVVLHNAPPEVLESFPIVLLPGDPIQLDQSHDRVEAFPARFGKLVILLAGKRILNVVIPGQAALLFPIGGQTAFEARIRLGKLVAGDLPGKGKISRVVGLPIEQAEGVNRGQIHPVVVGDDTSSRAQECITEEITDFPGRTQRLFIPGMLVPKQQRHSQMIMPPGVPGKIVGPVCIG